MSDQSSPHTDQHAAAHLEAALLAADRPMSSAKLAQAISLEEQTDIQPLIDHLNEVYVSTGRSFSIEMLAGGWRIVTRPEFVRTVAAIRGLKAQRGLSRAALETLSIIAYRQPITRAVVETIRGAACGDILRTLLERKLVRIAGRAEELGRPMLYATTPTFLETFGLGSIKDLPPVGDLLPPEIDDADPDAEDPTAESEEETASESPDSEAEPKPENASSSAGTAS